MANILTVTVGEQVALTVNRSNFYNGYVCGMSLSVVG